MPGAAGVPPKEGFTPKGKWTYTEKRVADSFCPPPQFNEETRLLLPPRAAGHESRSSPERSTKQCQLESHGTVLSQTMTVPGPRIDRLSL